MGLFFSTFGEKVSKFKAQGSHGQQLAGENTGTILQKPLCRNHLLTEGERNLHINFNF